MCLAINDIVKTNYDTGPYRITKVFGSCLCPEFVRSLNGDDTPSEPHYHFTCAAVELKDGNWVDDKKDKGEYYLGGYKNDNGTIVNVWHTEDRVIVIKTGINQQAPTKTTQLKFF